VCPWRCMLAGNGFVYPHVSTFVPISLHHSGHHVRTEAERNVISPSVAGEGRRRRNDSDASFRLRVFGSNVDLQQP
jgi:hypothetical protein